MCYVKPISLKRRRITENVARRPFMLKGDLGMKKINFFEKMLTDSSNHNVDS